MARSPPLPEPRTVLPSIAIVPLIVPFDAVSALSAPTTPPTQRRKTASNCFESSARRMRRKVSSDGTPFLSIRKRRSHAFFLRPQKAMSSTVSQSGRTAAIMMTRISRKSCKVPLLGLRGSSISAKLLIRDTLNVALTLFAQKTRVDVIFEGSTRCLHKVLKVNDYFEPAMPLGKMTFECGSPGPGCDKYTYPQLLVQNSATRPGSILDRHDGSIFGRR